MNQKRQGSVSSPAPSEGAARDGLVSGRKDHHIDICLVEDVTPPAVSRGLGGYALEYDALPELDLDAIDLSVKVLGKRLAAPIVVGAMTGGTTRAGEINRRLARAAAKAGVGMALGSQRAMLVKPELESTFVVKDVAPDVPLLFANVGAVQLNYGVGAAEVQTLVERVGADAVNLHLNPLQEAIQPEGDTRFSGLTAKIGALAEVLSFPCIAKEVGAGFGPRAAEKLASLPLAGIEVAGVGGTSWAKVESFRAGEGTPHESAGRLLAGFGIPTGASIAICRRALGPDRFVLGSGGVRNGLDVALAIALGADAAALARPLLEAANASEEAAERALETLIYELRVVMFCCGCRTVEELRQVRVLPPGRSWSEEAGR